MSTRREILQIGFSSYLGLGASSVFGCSVSSQPTPRARSVLFVFMFGGPSHIDTFDPKPQSPAEVRGEFGTIQTSIPGVVFGEHLPCIAKRADKLAIVRTMSCDRSLGAHDFATHAILTGVDKPPAMPTRSASRLSWPCYSAGIDAVQPRRDGLPNGVNLPNEMLDPTIGVYPGQHAGWLGAFHDPMQMKIDLASKGQQSSGVLDGLSVTKLEDRMALLGEVDRQQRAMGELAEAKVLSAQQQQAAALYSDGRLTRSLDMDRESDRIRDRYGRHQYGQSLLLARRLVQAGVPMVQVNLSVGVAQWDTHTDNFNGLRRLLPPFDMALSALLDDLEMTGLLSDVLLVVGGEFGRTPKLGGNIGTPFYSPTGRDHWTDCFFMCFAGAGVQGGQVIGSTDRIGAHATTTPHTPADLGATVYSALGIDPGSELTDSLGRPVRLNQGRTISAIYSG